MKGLGVSINSGKVRLYYHSPSSESEILTAESKDGLEFEKIKTSVKKLPSEIDNPKIVEDYKWNGNKVAYFGGDEIKVGVFKTLKKINYIKTGIRNENINVDFTLRTSQGIFVIYHNYIYIDNVAHLIVKAVFFDPADPSQIIWETKSSLISEPDFWKGKIANCLGFVYFNGKLISYWDIDKLGIFLIQFPVFNDHPAHEGHHYKLNKHASNPILSPKAENIWENEAAFNPAAFMEDGKIYLLYRALGYGYLSVLGYAESEDGINFTRPLDEPIYTARENFETKSPYANC
jgi:predicted GH43/DUF377 family glycosyl hydrolase